MKTGERLALAVLFFLLLFAVSVPTPTQAQPSDGRWQGFTGQGLPLRFDVSGGRVTNLRVEGEVVGAGCSVSFNFTDGASIPIVDDSFTVSNAFSFVSYTVEGTFESGNLASGRLVMSVNTVCPGAVITVWSASRDGAPPPVDPSVPLTEAEVECEATRLFAMAGRIAVTAPNTTKPVGLSLMPTRSGDFAGIAYTGNGPGTPEHLLTFSTNPEETSLLRNPERPQLFSVSATRNDLSSDLVAGTARDLIRITINPTLSANPPAAALVTLDNVRPPAGSPASAKAGRGLAHVLTPCHSKLSGRDVHVLQVLSRIARVQVAGAASSEIAFFRGESPNTFRIDAYPFTAAGTPLGRLAAQVEVTRDAAGSLNLGILRVLGPCDPFTPSGCTSLTVPGELQLVHPAPAGSFWQESPYAVSAPGVSEVEIDWADLLEGTSWRSPL